MQETEVGACRRGGVVPFAVVLYVAYEGGEEACKSDNIAWPL